MHSEYGDGFELLVTRVNPRREKEPSACEDTSLVEAACRGDRAAFGHLYRRYARMIHGVLLSKVPVAEVDDLVQDVFVMALRRLSTLREAQSFGAWLAAIARNLANDHYRRSDSTDRMDDVDPETQPGTRIAGEERDAAQVLEIIRTLPDAYRETLILRLVEGMTGPEIAARTGLTHGSVRVNLHRGMQMLRIRLSPRPDGDVSERRRRNQ